ncbi:MAG: glycosyltransferase family 1 protein [Alphaproteobacteria bacterium]|nr:glycosyltransferase family 1 protein [Alphaproteobacteria bacterium]
MSMKVLIISDAWHPQINGVVRTYEYIIKELDKKDYVTKVIGPSDFKRTMPMPFYPEIQLVLSPYKHLQSLIEDFGADRLHIATEGPLGWAARKYCLRNKIEFSTSYHTQFPDYVAKRFAWLIPPLYKSVHNLGIRVVKHFHKPSSAVMVSTQSLHQQLENWGFQNNMALLTRGVDFDIFKPGPANLFQDLPKPISLYVGRIAIEKSLEDFLEMPWEGSKVLVGDGPIMEELKGKYPDAHFIGKRTGQDLADCYRSSDVFVFPSRTDTFGIVLIEALASGLPVAAYNVTGPKDIIIHDYLGALEETDLKQACDRAMKNCDMESRIQHVKDHYSWEAAGKQFMAAL